MGQRNPIYNDYRRRRAKEKWLRRVPALLAVAAVLVIVGVIAGVVLPRVQGQDAPVEARVTPAVQATLAATATPGALVVMPAATLAPLPTATARPTVVAATATVLPSQFLATATPHPLPLPTGEGSEMDAPALQRLMLDLINADRQANGLTPVEWDEGAAQAATAHAEDMAAQGYFSHWNTQGYGPDVRYALAGGTDVIRENVASQWRRYDDGRPAPIDDWAEVMREAQTGLMNSPGHRANILDPFHTHVGVGIAYNAQTGETRIAQEFIHRYAALAGTPALKGNAVELNWTLLNGATEPLINVAFEPMPKPLSPDDLNNRMPRTYSSPAEIIDVMQPEAQGDGRFAARVPVGQNGAGLYHIRIWVKLGDEQVPAANVIVPVGAP
jgi:uncharacterized protein YkwD